MATATPEATPQAGTGAPDPTEPGVQIPDLADQYTRKVPKQTMGLKVAHQAMCLDDAYQILKMDRAVVNAHHIATMEAVGNAVNIANLGKTAGVPQAGADQTGDDMIHVGDVVWNQPPQAAAAPTSPAIPSPAPPAAPVVSGLSNLAKAGILAAVLGSGASIPLAASSVLSLFKSPPPAPAAEVEPDPGSWQLHIVQPDATTE